MDRLFVIETELTKFWLYIFSKHLSQFIHRNNVDDLIDILPQRNIKQLDGWLSDQRTAGCPGTRDGLF